MLQLVQRRDVIKRQPDSDGDWSIVFSLKRRLLFTIVIRLSCVEDYFLLGSLVRIEVGFYSSRRATTYG